VDRPGVFDRLGLAALDAYEQMIGLNLTDVAVDGCITKAPCGGECAGRSPVDRGKGGMKRSQLTDGAGVPMATVCAPANTWDDTLLGQTLDELKDFQPLPAEVTVHLDAGCDHRPSRAALEERGLGGEIAARGTPAPIQVGKRGRWSGPTPGSTTSASSAAAPNAAATASMPTSPWLPPSSPSVRYAGLPGCSRWDSRPPSRRIRGPAGGGSQADVVEKFRAAGN
jgi:hypothetical protein